MVNYAGSEQEVKEVVEAIVAASGKSVVIQASLGKVEDIRRLFVESKAAIKLLQTEVLTYNSCGLNQILPLKA